MKKKVMVSLIALIIFTSCSPPQMIVGCKTSERNIAGNSHFKILWSKPNLSVYDDPFTPLLQGVNSVVVALIQNPDYRSSKIIAVDALSGNLLWEREVTLPAAISAGNSSVYVGINDKIQEYESSTGHLVREISFPNVGIIYNLFSNEQGLYAHTKSGKWLTYHFENNSSELSDPFLPYTPFVSENGILYLYDTEGVKAVAIKSKAILWQYPITEAINLHPHFTTKMIIILSQTGNIYVLDKQSGNLIWKSDKNVISNVAGDSSRLYFLTADGHLNVVDSRNGNEIEVFKISPTEFNATPSGPSDTIGAFDIWVDSNNNTIIFSLGDSCQLMALKVNIP